MRTRRSHRVGLSPLPAGFTLIELLVVVAIVSILLAVSLQALRRARILAYRIRCGANLGQIAIAWHSYLNDNSQQFYQKVNANHHFGGWKGIAGGAPSRPLNPYVSLPAEPNGPQGTEVFRCPADKGDQNCEPSAYVYYGNSYQTNLMLIGPDSLPSQQWVSDPVRTLNQRINERLENLSANAVCDDPYLLLMGDNNWVRQWSPLSSAAGRAWHGTEGRYNMAFFDGHVALVNIRKGVYLDPDYRIQPFKDLDEITYETQRSIVNWTASHRAPLCRHEEGR